MLKLTDKVISDLDIGSISLYDNDTNLLFDISYQYANEEMSLVMYVDDRKGNCEIIRANFSTPNPIRVSPDDLYLIVVTKENQHHFGLYSGELET